ncbi:malectin domain-containing carbohydrate-binding protein [Cyclobacterium sp.]|uniref:malectin domain-containing carbohydrate-binding protein n=1 Tax=Cyclobacterium sp. TaxID=1966343 RepID=UPI0019BDE377|nr:malectin domain-containing carbohydrate-binding protein [Cyclobacterium sp.]MBD3626490.1 right-handed parallel beta-helix repeat-containing protein [Cyclobacterium sp.]
MKNLISILLLLLVTATVPAVSHGASYYFSQQSGNDSRSFAQAQNPDTPWKSIEKLNAIFPSLKPGDKVLFRRGETFFGTIVMSNSGISGNPIVIGAYGNGERPIITGLVDIKNWKSLGNGIYESVQSGLKAQKTNMVVINDQDIEMGRYPNSNSSNKGYLNYESTSWNSITDKELSSWPNWTGAEVVIRKIYWILDRHKITSHSGSTITYASNSETNYQPKADFGYFIQNHIKTLDQKGEWYYDEKNAKINVFFGNESPFGNTVQVATLDLLLTQVKRVDHVIIENLHFRGANKDAISLANGRNVSLKNAKVEFAGVNGIFAEGNDQLLLENNEIINIHNSGLDLKSCDDPVIKNNLIQNIQLYPGMGKSGDGNGFGIFSSNDNSRIENNQVINSGYVGIRFGGNNSLVKNNFINHFNKTKNDGGGIYVYTGSGNETYYNRKVIGNIILNGYGVVEGTNIRSALAKPQSEGIYLDDNTTGVEVAYNTIANVSSKGIYLHNARHNNIHHNTVYNSTYQIFFRNDEMGADISNNRIENNIFFSQNSEQNNLNISSIKNDIGKMGVFSNNVYASPMTDNYRIINRYNMGTIYDVTKVLDLEGWKKEYGMDTGSKIHPVNIPSYEVIGLLGDNKYDNEGFTKDANYVTTKNAKTYWESQSKLDGGALRVIGSGTFEFNVRIGKVEKGKNYLIKFSGIGNKNFAGKAYFRQKYSPHNIISAVSAVEFSYERNEYEILLSPASSSDETVLLFSFTNVSSADFQIDNLSLHEADLQLTDPEEMILFAYNDKNTEQSISLSGEYVDMHNNPHTGSVKVAPFRSIILIKTSDKNISQPEPIQEVRVIIPEYGSGMIEGDDLPITLAVDEGRELDVEKVNYYYCEKLISTEEETPLASIWKSIPYGSHYIYAEAVDIYGRTVFSDSVAIEVKKENVLPVVNFIDPLNDLILDAGEEIQIKASAIDLDGAVTQVNLMVNDKIEASSASSPYEFSWKSTTAGTYSLFLQAVDNDMAIGISSPVQVTIESIADDISTSPNEPSEPAENNTVTDPGFSLFVNLGTQKEVSYQENSFIGEQVVTSSIIGKTYTYSNTKFNEALFQTERNGEEFAISLDVPNGTYTVKTYHNELYFGHGGPSAGVGRRVFDIELEGKQVKNNFDLYLENNNKPTILTFTTVQVNDGKLDLNMVASSNRASICGLSIITENDLVPVLRLKTGYNQSVSYGGENFKPDYNLNYFSTSNTYTNSQASEEKLFQHERNAPVLKYSIPVENGVYTVKTYHNELYFGKVGPAQKAGNRVFDLFIENKLVKDDFDLFVENNNQETILSFEKIHVNDGVLNLDMVASNNRATISAIEIFKETSEVQAVEVTDHVFLLNTGGKTDETLSGDIFLAEENNTPYYNSPSYRFENNLASQERIFQTERNGENLQYAIPVPNGHYTVLTMHNELWFGQMGPSASSGRRVFDIVLEDKTVKAGFDIYVENANAPTILAFEDIEVTDGVLHLKMIAKENRASISGIAIVGTGAKSGIAGANLRGYREMFGRGYKEMIGRGYKEMDLYVEEESVENDIRIYPNPAKDKAVLELGEEISQGRILIHNMSGQLVSHYDLNWIRSSSSPNKFTIPLDNVAQGVYLISVSKDQSIISRQRLIVNP